MAPAGGSADGGPGREPGRREGGAGGPWNRQAVNVVTVLVGAAVGDSAPLLVLDAMLLGGIGGSVRGIERRLEGLGAIPQRRFAGAGATEDRTRFVEGFVSSSLVFYVGPLTILGSLNDGLGNDADQLYPKPALDGFAAIAFAASFGWGWRPQPWRCWSSRAR